MCPGLIAHCSTTKKPRPRRRGQRLSQLPLLQQPQARRARRAPVVRDDAVGVAAVGGRVGIAPVLGVVREHAALAVLVVPQLAQLARAAGAHEAPARQGTISGVRGVRGMRQARLLTARLLACVLQHALRREGTWRWHLQSRFNGQGSRTTVSRSPYASIQQGYTGKHRGTNKCGRTHPMPARSPSLKCDCALLPTSTMIPTISCLRGQYKVSTACQYGVQQRMFPAPLLRRRIRQGAGTGARATGLKLCACQQGPGTVLQQGGQQAHPGTMGKLELPHSL